MEKMRFVRNEMRSLIRSRRMRSGFRATDSINGYTFAELEEMAENVPLDQLSPILLRIMSQYDLICWWAKFQMDLSEIKATHNQT